MSSILDERICDVMECEDNTETFREFIVQLEERAHVHEPDISMLTNNQVLDYIDALWVIAATSEL